MNERKSDIPASVNALARMCTHAGLPFIGGDAKAIVAWGEYLTDVANDARFKPAPERA